MTALLALAFVLLVPQVTSSSACGTWQECRRQALEAAERRDFEAFHDLAWRALQAGPRNDPSLMQLVARAQSLSGRPGDALVMLQRLAAMGVTTDAATSEDFASVRRLPRWREVDAQPGAAPADRSASATSSPPPPPALPAASAPPSGSTAPGEALRFTMPQFMPGGLAYDAVSRRFIIGHRDARKLSVVDEFSRQVANLAASGFADVTAIEIDPRDGTLWVVSAGEPAADSTAPATSLHKLQLISGRALSAFSPPAESGARFVDVVVAPTGVVLALDAQGRRVYRLAGGAPRLELAAVLGDVRPTSIAAAAGAIAYVAHETGVLRVDLTTRGVSPVSLSDTDLSGIEWLRWHRGSLIALQRAGSGHQVVRLKLLRESNGRPRIDILDPGIQSPGRATAAIAGDVLYVLTAGGNSELVLRKLPLAER